MSEDNNAAVNMAMLAGGMYGPNKWSQFPNGIQSTSYSGTPTDALGRAIRPPPGVTLNQTPAQPQAATPPSAAPLEAQGSQARAMQNAGYGDWAMLDPMMAQTNRPNPTAEAGSVGATKGWNAGNPASIYPSTPAAAGQAGATGSQGAPGSPATSYQNALKLLSDPGPVTTPGATVPQSQPLSGQPSVLDQFLATQHGGTGAGGYSNQGFFDTLNKLRSTGSNDTNVAPTALSPGSNMVNQLAGAKSPVTIRRSA